MDLIPIDEKERIGKLKEEAYKNNPSEYKKVKENIQKYVKEYFVY